MKTKDSLLFLLISFYSFSLLAQGYNKQNTYLDALELAKISNSVPKNTKDTVYDITSFIDAFREIIFKYGNENEFSMNPFLYDVPNIFDIVLLDQSPNSYENLRTQIIKNYSSDLFSATSLAVCQLADSSHSRYFQFCGGTIQRRNFTNGNQPDIQTDCEK